jgi:hypothetical protein
MDAALMPEKPAQAFFNGNRCKCFLVKRAAAFREKNNFQILLTEGGL